MNSAATAGQSPESSSVEALLAELWNLQENNKYSRSITNFSSFKQFCISNFGFTPSIPSQPQVSSLSPLPTTTFANANNNTKNNNNNTENIANIPSKNNIHNTAALAVNSTENLKLKPPVAVQFSNPPSAQPTLDLPPAGKLANLRQHTGLYTHKLKLSRIPLADIVQNSQNVPSSSVFSLVKHEKDDLKLISTVDTLKQHNNWSLMQPKKFSYKRNKCHYDHLLDSVHALALDYYHERRWKMAMAYFFALQCSQHSYHSRDMTASSSNSIPTTPFFPLTLSIDTENMPTFYLPDSSFAPSESTDSLNIIPLHKHSLSHPFDSGKPKIARILNDERLYFASLQPILLAEIMKNTIVPSHPPNLQIRAPVTWSQDEDDFLMKCTPLCNQNWQLLSELLSNGRKKKLDWDCYSRYQALAQKLAGSSTVVQTSSMGMGLVGMMAFNKSSGRRDEKRRAAKHAHFFDGVMKIIKKRDHAKAKKSMDVQDDEKKLSLTSHMSHQAILQRAGFDTKNIKSVSDLSERRIKLAKMLEQRAAGQPTPGAPPTSGVPQNQPRPPRSSSPMPPQTGSPRPPLAPARPQMTMTQAQVQQFIQRQNMLRQFPNMPMQQPGMMNLMPVQRFMYRQPVPRPGSAPLTPQQQQQQQMALQQSQMRRSNVTPEMVAMIEEAKKAQAAIVSNFQQQNAMQRQQQVQSIAQSPPNVSSPNGSGTGVEASPRQQRRTKKKD